MDPISLSFMAIGTGMQIFSAFSGASSSKEYAQQQTALNNKLAGEEQKLNEVKRQKMEVEGRRAQIENIRNNQRARANAEAGAVNQGANQGSGIQGGLAQIQGQTAWNMEGVNDSLSFGRQNFDITNTISGLKTQQANLQAKYQSTQAQNQGIASLGGSLMKIGPTVGPMFQGFGGGQVGTFSQGGNNGLAPTWG